jgi:hypothetical protein
MVRFFLLEFTDISLWRSLSNVERTHEVFFEMKELSTKVRRVGIQALLLYYTGVITWGLPDWAKISSI